MAGKENAVKKYVVRLCAEERAQLTCGTVLPPSVGQGSRWWMTISADQLPGGVVRQGFERMVAEVCPSNVGA